MGESEYESRFEVWSNPGGLIWSGPDQEDAILEYLRMKRQYGASRYIECIEHIGTTFRRLAPRGYR